MSTTRQEKIGRSWPPLNEKVLVVTKLFQLKYERFPHCYAARNRAIARLPGNNAPQRARVDELLWHGLVRLVLAISGIILLHARFPVSKEGRTNLR